MLGASTEQQAASGRCLISVLHCKRSVKSKTVLKTSALVQFKRRGGRMACGACALSRVAGRRAAGDPKTVRPPTPPPHVPPHFNQPASLTQASSLPRKHVPTTHVPSAHVPRRPPQLHSRPRRLPRRRQIHHLLRRRRRNQSSVRGGHRRRPSNGWVRGTHPRPHPHSHPVSVLRQKHPRSIPKSPPLRYHFYRRELDALPDPAEAHRRRGAPWTFDAAAFVAAVRAARAGSRVSVPSFDHAAGDPVPVCAHPPPPAARSALFSLPSHSSSHSFHSSPHSFYSLSSFPLPSASGCHPDRRRLSHRRRRGELPPSVRGALGAAVVARRRWRGVAGRGLVRGRQVSGCGVGWGKERVFRDCFSP